MYYIIKFAQLFFPFVTLSLLIIGLKLRRQHYIITALWFSLIACIIHYQLAGGEILGSYFDYEQALIYSLNLIMLVITILYIVLTAVSGCKKWIAYLTASFVLLLVVLVTLLLANLWINAHFLSDRQINTPILQVATFKKLAYCHHHYVFYKLNIMNQVDFLCPNQYGLLPAYGQLKNIPQFLIRQLPQLEDKK